MPLLKSILTAIAALGVSASPAAPKVVFLTGDDEYRSEESMPMLGEILRRDFGFDIEVGFSLGEDGTVDPAAATSLTKMEELADADLVVLFLRFRQPTLEQFQFFLDFLKAGKPVVAFRSSTHAFRFVHGAGLNDWGVQGDPSAAPDFSGGDHLRTLVGQKWITHHGHFDDGKFPLTSVSVDPGADAHPTLRGVKPFEAYSWLYHVQGGGDTLAGNPTLLLHGRAMRSKKEADGELDRYPKVNPIAWTKTHEWGEAPARVFTTTLGHPYDFRDAQVRRFALQGILWALGKEDQIPGEGVKADPVNEYAPNNSGFGPDKPKQGLRPETLFPPAS